MSWMTINALSCDICDERYEGKPGRPRANVISQARIEGWHTRSHGVLVVCPWCIAEQPLDGDVVMHAARLGSHDIPNALLLAELVADAPQVWLSSEISRARLKRAQGERERG